MKLLNKLTLRYLIVSLFVVVVAITGIVTINSIDLAFNQISDQTMPVIEALEDVRAESLKIGSSANEFALLIAETTSNVTVVEDTEKEQVRIAIKRYDAAILQYEGLVNQYFPDEKNLVKNVKISGSKLQNASNELIALKEQGVSGPVVIEKWEEFEAAKQEFLKVIDDTIAHENKEMAQRKQETENTIATSIKTILFACLLTFAAAIILGVYTSRTISGPITKLKDSVVELGKGKLDTRVNIESDDEFGILAECFNNMASMLEQDITKQKQVEKELEKHRDHLEELVDERTGELREGKVKYHTLYESSSDAIMMLDEDGFFDCNNATLQMFGFTTKEAFVKVHPADVSSPYQPDGVDSMTAANIKIAEAFSKGKNFFEWIHRRSNGEDFPAEVLLTAFPLGGKQVLQATVRDITERKRAEEHIIEQERMATAIAELEFKALSGLNLNTLMNAACSLLVSTLGVEYCRVLELMPDGDLLPRAEIGFNKNIIGSAISGKGIESLADYTLLSGDTVIVEDLSTEIRFREPLLMEHGIISGMSAIIGEPGASCGVIGVHTTKQRVFTLEEITFLETVTNVLAQATKRKHIEDLLKLAKDEALRANTVKTNFLMTMSHELRTPLNAVIGFSEMLKQKTVGELNEKQESYVDNITTGGNNLLNIISQILELVRTESEIAELQIENIPVHQIVDEVISSIKKEAKAKNVNIEKNIDPELDNIDADKYKLKQVFIILLDNAVKFSKKDGGTITIIAKKEGGMVRFSVSDTGIGIEEEDIGKIFKKFTQLDSGTSRKHGGIGIGLALVKLFVELHGGNISVESKSDVGSTFKFLLPIEVRKEGKIVSDRDICNHVE